MLLPFVPVMPIDAPARFAREELDVADEVEAVGRGLAQEGLGERDAGRDDDLVGALEHGRVEAAERGRRTGHQAPEFREPRRVFARIGHDQPVPARGEVPGGRHAGAAEAHDHAARDWLAACCISGASASPARSGPA